MKTVDSSYLVIGALWLVIGMILGIVMGASHNFQFMPLHAHVNLVGFACHSIFGLVYRQWPAMKASRLALLQFWLFVLATPITLVGLYFTLSGGPELPTIIGSLGLVLGALLFFVMIWRARNTN
ncbi:MAG: hypothetical protein WA747_12910 [Steroidobacteraceae bacterium]